MRSSTGSNSSQKKKILGIWNLDKAPLTLGGLIYFIEELRIQEFIHKTHSVEICLLGEGIPSVRSYAVSDCDRIPSDYIGACKPDILRQLSIIPIIKDFSPISECHIASTFSQVQEVLDKKQIPYSIWPEIPGTNTGNYKYCTTLYTQQFFHDNGFIPRLQCSGVSDSWAKQFLQDHCSMALPVVVHLKNNANCDHCSNADFTAWYGFLSDYADRCDIKFILIGNEPVDSRIAALPNVIVSKEYSNSISNDLALIYHASIFMGMSSGPCNIAILSDIPYIIFKNPDHDVEEMKEELGNSTRFSFSATTQQLLRIFETKEILIQEFEKSYADAIKIHAISKDTVRKLTG